MGQPYIAVYDKDNQSYKSPDAIASANKSSQDIKSIIDRTLGSSIIFDNYIEEEIGITEDINKNKPYFTFKFVSNPTFLISKSLHDKVIEIFK